MKDSKVSDLCSLQFLPIVCRITVSGCLAIGLGEQKEAFRLSCLLSLLILVILQDALNFFAFVEQAKWHF